MSFSSFLHPLHEKPHQRRLKITDAIAHWSTLPSVEKTERTIQIDAKLIVQTSRLLVIIDVHALERIANVLLLFTDLFVAMIQRRISIIVSQQTVLKSVSFITANAFRNW